MAVIPSVAYCLISGLVLSFVSGILFGAAHGPYLDVASEIVAVLALPPPCTASGCCINPYCMICLLVC
jgi:hypothetical protein